jgi:hypothetical protein
MRVKFKAPNKGINFDLDGTLTGLGPNSWSTSRWGHNEQPECTLDMAKFDGLICPPETSVRRIMFFSPSGGANKKNMYIW